MMAAMRLPFRIRSRTARAATLGLAITIVAVLFPALDRNATVRAADPRHLSISLSLRAQGLTNPVAIAAPNDGTNRLFIVEQAGRVRVYIPGSGLRSTPFLDIRSEVLDGGERGLLGLAFHPNYQRNGKFYVYYTDNSGNIQISKFTTSPTGGNVSGTTETKILHISHPTYANHNGGQLAFRGGYLYIGTGDGGGGGDPSHNAQSRSVLLGKILRIDINHKCGTKNYCSPSTNPYYSSSTKKHEIWDYGLRNPWRFSFNTATGGLYIGDVGQDTYEEIDAIHRGDSGLNMGWDCYEGPLNTVNLYGGTYCGGRTFKKPVYWYGHSNGRCAIVGGFVYNGKTYASVMGGVYLYADYCTGEIWGLKDTSNGWVNSLVGKRAAQITSFGQSISGELYMVDTHGALWHITGHAR
jgi:glucose/arabinose dehydrogenase